MKNAKLCALLSLLLVGFCAGVDVFPKTLSTQSGTVSRTDTSVLKTKELTGTADKWETYIEFYGSTAAYSGIFVFDVSSVGEYVCSFGLNVNYKGPTFAEQVWQFEWFNHNTGAWVFAGDNTNAAQWQWTVLDIAGSEDFNNLVSNNELQLRFSSKTAFDNCNLDYLSLYVKGAEAVPPSTSSPTSAPPPPPPATAAPTSAPPPPATAAPTPRPTSAPTAKPTPAPAKPTSAPTTRPTSAPTSAPAKPTSAPTAKATSAPAKPSTNGKICPSGTHYRPGPGTTWQWQLSGSKIDTAVNAQMFDIDMFDASAATIQTLHSLGRAVTCYIDTAYEPGRPDSSSFTSQVLGSGIDGWPGQKWVDIRSSVVRNVMANRMAQAAAKGCDAVEMDDVDAYDNNPGFPLTAADQLDFNSFLATTAHANGLGIALKNDLSQVAALASKFDFAINEQCYEYSECDYLNTFITQGKAVFGVEYEMDSSQFCTKANTAKFSWLKKNLDLDASLTQCCPSCSGTYTCVSSTSRRSLEDDGEDIITHSDQPPPIFIDGEGLVDHSDQPTIFQGGDEFVEHSDQPTIFEDEKVESNSAVRVSGFACFVVIALFAALL